jgi:predicted anti-sigma-YlaC factor YlaD
VSRGRSLVRCVLAPLVVLGVATGAHANGRFPAVDQLVAEPGNPDHLVLRATFGLLVSKDRGESWGFLCEDALGYRDMDPALAVLEGGRILLGVTDGVSVGDEAGCTFTHAAGIDGHVIDLTAALGEPGTAYAATIAGTSTRFWATTNAGDSFEPLGDELPEFTATTLDAAPSNPDVIYAAGLLGDGGGFLRSEDRGESFTAFTVPDANAARRPYIAAVDPTDERRVYVRLEGLPGLVFVTEDGGESFTRILALDIPAVGFALSPDGATIVASNPYDGTFNARRGEYAFERVACKGPSCLAFTGDTLYGCGDNYVDGFIVGRSRDLGASFERVADYGCLEGVSCTTASVTGMLCRAVWPQIAEQLGAGVCEPRTVPPDRSCLGGTGEGGAAGDTSTTGGTSDGGSAGRGGTPAGGRGGTAGSGGGQAGRDASAGAGASAEDPSGCGCRLGSGARGRWDALAVALLSFSWLRRATRRRERPNPTA